MQPRILGEEAEYALQFYPRTLPGVKSSPLSAADTFSLFAAAILQSRLVYAHEGVNQSRDPPTFFKQPDIRPDHIFLVNGARFYQDSGAHGEFATPECISPRQVVAYDKAGERTLEQLTQIAERNLGRPGKLVVIKNNVDTSGNTYGCHENYLVVRKIHGLDETDTWKLFVKHLVPFFVTRQVIVGCGKAFNRNGQIEFNVAQRSDFIEEELSSSTTSKRGILNLKDEPLSSREQYRRLHILIGDANMSERSTWLKFGITDIVLQLIENNALESDLTLADPVLYVTELSKNPHTRIPMKNGSLATAYDIQSYYLHVAQKNPHLFRSQEYQELIQAWEQELQDFQEGRTNRRLDWPLRKRILEGYLEKQGTDFKTLSAWSGIIRALNQAGVGGSLTSLHRLQREQETSTFLESALNREEYKRIDGLLRGRSISKKELPNLPRLYVAYHGLLERDIAYNNISQRDGLFYALRRGGIISPPHELVPGLTEETINDSMSHAPPQTRASIREKVIYWSHATKIPTITAWDSVTIYNTRVGTKFSLPNPFSRRNRGLSRFMNSVQHGRSI